MFTYGLSITTINDPLNRASIEQISIKIKNPKEEFKSRIDQLRRVKELNPKEYKHLKKSLPYFCCAKFRPAIRKKENFASINAFTLDFDNFTEAELSREHVFEKLKTDPNIRLLFTTPSGDGLKAVFILDEACTDPGLYSHFYKSFAQKFAQNHQLEKVIDWITHDVTRATFFSADPTAWDNPNATKVKIGEYISGDMDLDFSQNEKKYQELAKEHKREKVTTDLNPELMDKIKSKLKPNYKSKKEKVYFVPEEIEKIIPEVEKLLKESEIDLVETTPIQYGKQIKVKLGAYWAEVNLYFGQKGFTIVRTTKTGSNSELADLTFQIIDSFLNK